MNSNNNHKGRAMRIAHNLLLTLFSFSIACLSVACGGEEDDTTPSYADVNGFAPADDDNSPTAQLRRDFYNQTGSYLLFKDTLITRTSDGRSELLDITYFIMGSIDWQSDYEYTYEYIEDIEQQRKAAEYVQKYLISRLGKNTPYSFFLVNDLHYDYHGRLWQRDKVLGLRSYVISMGGGEAYEVIVGGAPLNQEIEAFLRDIDFPITVGYGTTECAPLISYSDYHDFVSGSCGTAVDHMEVKILSNNPHTVAGEIVTRGTNVMLGYYKNEKATQKALDTEGWYHTGDLGTLSYDGHLFIRGRLKNMLLGANGQNIYPEEIEDKLSSMTMVSECIVVQRGDNLSALVYPDMDEVKEMGFTDDDLQGVMEQNRQQLNEILPPYSRIQTIELRMEEFEKTPKKSIKRYLYK